MENSYIVEPIPNLGDICKNLWDADLSIIQLEYVEAWSNEYHPDYDDAIEIDKDTKEERWVKVQTESKVPYTFVYRLFNNLIKDHDEIKTRYEGAWELQRTLDAYGIDKSKYFYLCLLIKDYIDNLNLKRTVFPREIVKQITDKLCGMEYYVDKFGYLRVKHTAELSIKVEGERGGFKTKDSKVLYAINIMLKNFYEKLMKNPDDWFNLTYASFENEKLSTTVKAYIFHEYLDSFLKNKKYKRGYRSVDRGKDLLISRSLYIFKVLGDTNDTDRTKFYEASMPIDNNDRSNNPRQNNYLRDLIKKVKKNPSPLSKVKNSVYR